jgi:hypothetical protein
MQNTRVWQSVRLLASSALAGDATIVVHNYWQVVCWQKMREWKCAAIGKQCASRKCNNGGAWLLVSSVLVKDATMEVRGLLSTGVTSRQSESK